MSPVFGHGQLRLYLLAVLQEGPRHGYDVIQELERRFDGWYTPSAGTVYPRLAKLEEEGLVARSDDGRKATYHLTEAGRAYISTRQDELADLRADLDRAVGRIADEVRARVHGGAASLREELDRAARAARASASPAPQDADADAVPAKARSATGIPDLERRFEDLRRQARDGWRHNAPTAEQIDEIARILTQAARAISEVLGRR